MRIPKMTQFTNEECHTYNDLEQWASEWVCKCGKQFRKSTNRWALFTSGSDSGSSRFMTFGFCTLCPKCGGNLGERGPSDQVEYQVGRFHIIRNKRAIYRWWNPLTWPKYHVRYEHEIRGEQKKKDS